MYRERLDSGSIGHYLAEKAREEIKTVGEYLQKRGPRIAVGLTAYFGALVGLEAAKAYLSVGTFPYAAASMAVGALTSLGVLGAILGAGLLGYKGIIWLWRFCSDRAKEAKEREAGKTAPAPTG